MRMKALVFSATMVTSLASSGFVLAQDRIEGDRNGMRIWQQERYNPGLHAGRAEDEARNEQDRRDADTDMRNRRRGYYGPGPFERERTVQIRQDERREWRGAAYRR